MDYVEYDQIFKYLTVVQLDIDNSEAAPHSNHYPIEWNNTKFKDIKRAFHQKAMKFSIVNEILFKNCKIKVTYFYVK